MDFKTVQKLVQEQLLAIEGKRKFIEYLRCVLLGVSGVQNVQVSTKECVQCISVLQVPTLFGLTDYYIELETTKVRTVAVLKVIIGNLYYYSTNRTINYGECSTELREYFENAVQSAEHNYTRIKHDYSALTKHFGALLEMLLSDFSTKQCIKLMAFLKAGVPGAEGDAYSFLPARASLLTYDEIFPEMQEDTFFNLRLQGLRDHDIQNIVQNMHYNRGYEVLSVNMLNGFFLRCLDIL